MIHRPDELWAQAVYRVPSTREAQNLAERFRRHGESYLRFITTPGVEPTNNLTEQAIRFVAIDRLVTQGSRSEAGRRWNGVIRRIPRSPSVRAPEITASIVRDVVQC